MPPKPYPEWDPNWDFREPTDDDAKKKHAARRLGAHRHIILVWHGQYDEEDDDDARAGREELRPAARAEDVAQEDARRHLLQVRTTRPEPVMGHILWP